MGGPRYTKDQLRRATKVLGETGSIAEAARVVGVSRPGLRDALGTAVISQKRLEHANACEEGLRASRARMEALALKVDRYINEAIDTNAIEPRDLAAVVGSAAKLSDTLVTVTDREDRRRKAPIERRKLLAEIKVLEARLLGTLPADKVEVTHDARDELAARIARLTGSDGTGSAGEGDPPPSSDGG